MLGILCLNSCTTNDELLIESPQTRSLENALTVLKERDSQYPLELSRNKSLKSQRETARGVLQHSDYLGFSYKLNHFPLGTTLNLGNPIIDINKIKENEPFYIVEKDAGIQYAKAFSYASFDRYSHKSKDTQKITTGVSLDLKLFSIGNKHNIENTYTSNIANETNRVFGQLDVEVLGKTYTLQTSSNLLNKIKLNYLNPTFRDEIYSITMSEFIKNYGALVLTDFVTGGRVTALYSGVYQSNDETETKERNMDTDISATYGANKETSGSGSFGIGKSYYNENSTSRKIANMTTSIKAIGGNLNLPTFTAPQQISQINIDLAGWMKSLTPDTYQMINVQDGGLVPISQFVLEENIERHVGDYLRNGSIAATSIQEPYIEILRRETFNITLLITSLVTKNGDRVSIDVKNLWYLPEDLKLQYIEQTKNDKAKVYGLKIILKHHVSDRDVLAPENWFDYNFYDENLFSKYIDEENNTMYLLYKNDSKAMVSEENSIKKLLNAKKTRDTNFEDENGAILSKPGPGRFGLSLYNYRNTLNLYGLTEFVNKLPVANINKEELVTYRIISL